MYNPKFWLNPDLYVPRSKDYASVVPAHIPAPQITSISDMGISKIVLSK